MGAHGHRGVGNSGGNAEERDAPRRATPRTEVGGELLWKLVSTVMIIDALRSEYAPLIGVGFVIVVAGAGWFRGIRG